MEIKTGYFAYTKRYQELGYDCISIARFTPKWFNGSILNELSPTFDLLDRYKRGLVSEKDYKDEYYSMLRNVDIDSIVKELIKRDKVILLCYEKSDDFCHRHILSEYLRSIGVDIEEFNHSNLKRGIL